jgi:hypothetical protein
VNYVFGEERTAGMASSARTGTQADREELMRQFMVSAAWGLLSPDDLAGNLETYRASFRNGVLVEKSWLWTLRELGLLLADAAYAKSRTSPTP